MKKKKSDSSVWEFNLEQKVVHKLVLFSSLPGNSGLFNGKMGLIIFFLHYCKHTGNKTYESIAYDLLDEIMKEISEDSPKNFSIGLSGIGWGIEYMIQKGFVEGDSLEVCEEVDRKLMEKDPVRITDYSIATGLGGVLHYILAHIKGVHGQTGNLPFDKKYLNDLFLAASQLESKEDIPEQTLELAGKYIAFCKTGRIPDYTLDILPFINNGEIDEKTIGFAPVGINDGLAGMLMHKLNILSH